MSPTYSSTAMGVAFTLLLPQSFGTLAAHKAKGRMVKPRQGEAAAAVKRQ